MTLHVIVLLQKEIAPPKNDTNPLRAHESALPQTILLSQRSTENLSKNLRIIGMSLLHILGIHSALELNDTDHSAKENNVTHIKQKCTLHHTVRLICLVRHICVHTGFHHDTNHSTLENCPQVHRIQLV